jgi:hypothetical protein
LVVSADYGKYRIRMPQRPLSQDLSRTFQQQKQLHPQSFQQKQQDAEMIHRRRFSSDDIKSGDSENQSEMVATKSPRRLSEDEEADEFDSKRYRSMSYSTTSSACSSPHFEVGKMVGEHRLRISFASFGVKGRVPQTFGKKGMFIPDGLSGSHTMYNENWEFQVRHESEEVEEGVVCINWTIRNMTTGMVHSITETVSQAKKRIALGHTISNRVFRKAMECRARDLEASLDGERNDCRLSNVKSLVKSLRPTSFSEGLLAFGLQHKIVQEHMGNQ